MVKHSLDKKYKYVTIKIAQSGAVLNKKKIKGDQS